MNDSMRGAIAIGSSRTLHDSMSTQQFERIELEENTCDDTGGESVCAYDEYCHRGTGSCDGLGVCMARPQVCTMEYTPGR
mmetsp:Transcript_4516/g.11388  ORF Transcript_4516/g.11388 Transcript_4516/m.11388 type:complete len:80 (-) Transcript_4516:318-557(-)